VGGDVGARATRYRLATAPPAAGAVRPRRIGIGGERGVALPVSVKKNPLAQWVALPVCLLAPDGLPINKRECRSVKSQRPDRLRTGIYFFDRVVRSNYS